jgi:hypothetical protein
LIPFPASCLCDELRLSLLVQLSLKRPEPCLYISTLNLHLVNVPLQAESSESIDFQAPLLVHKGYVLAESIPALLEIINLVL